MQARVMLWSSFLQHQYQLSAQMNELRRGKEMVKNHLGTNKILSQTAIASEVKNRRPQLRCLPVVIRANLRWLLRMCTRYAGGKENANYAAWAEEKNLWATPKLFSHEQREEGICKERLIAWAGCFFFARICNPESCIALLFFATFTAL